MDVKAGSRILASKSGSSASGRVNILLRVRAPRGVRIVAVVATVADAVGNESMTTRSVKLK